MKHFIHGLGFPLLSNVVLAASTATAYALLAPTGADVGNQEIVRIFSVGAWLLGPVLGLLSVLLIGLLNALRRILRIRKVRALHGPTVLLGILPWLIFAWVLTGEPRHTSIARAIIDFAGRPMLWGAGVTCIAVLLITLPTFLPSKK